MFRILLLKNSLKHEWNTRKALYCS